MRALPALAASLTLFSLAGCRSEKESSPATSRWDLTSAPHLARWVEAEMSTIGHLAVGSEDLTLTAGSPMSGAVYTSWETDELPVTSYRISYEAMRVEGDDFFGSVTFPVGEISHCVTFVLGGWGGSQVGISSIDGHDASQNSTGSSQTFENGRWYEVKIEVRPESIQVWYDGKPLVNMDITGRDLGLRPGEIEKCVPFGFATYGTTGRIRRVIVEKL